MRRSRRGKEGQYGIGNLTLLPPRPAPTARAASVCEESFAGGPSGFGSEAYVALRPGSFDRFAQNLGWILKFFGVL